MPLAASHHRSAQQRPASLQSALLLQAEKETENCEVVRLKRTGQAAIPRGAGHACILASLGSRVGSQATACHYWPGCSGHHAGMRAQIDKCFGFDTAVEESQRALLAAKVEASSAYNGVGLVRLMGRQSGYIAMQASMASGAARSPFIPA